MSVDIQTMMKFILQELPELNKNDLNIMSKQEIAKFYQELRQVNGLTSTYQQNDIWLNQKKSQENKLSYSSKSTFRSPQYQDSQRKQKKKKKSAKKDYLLKQLDIPIQKKKFDYKNQMNRSNFEARDKKLKQKKQLSQLKNNKQSKAKMQYQSYKQKQSNINNFETKTPKQKHVQILAYSQQIIEQNLITDQFDNNKKIKFQLDSNKPQPQVLQWIKKLKQTIGQLEHIYLNNFVQQQDSQMQQQ